MLRITTPIFFFFSRIRSPCKGQLISEGNFGVFKSPKKFFVRISTLAPKMDQINKIKTLYHIG
jgi:hypothetical protein